MIPIRSECLETQWLSRIVWYELCRLEKRTVQLESRASLEEPVEAHLVELELHEWFGKVMNLEHLKKVEVYLCIQLMFAYVLIFLG